ncbi:hypothetical protein N7510_005006 [Penicillium lagena]|uniref:uncharacterized protein n=1 Tax=Penicillium lagena TaxID=94218 RepID=UPI002540E397|nr:uncharacterized protein N7510_005006 [Penicillium lagena]KAJ5621022.1 hypothetical protein N7510_005006 [Penicillium lagena]
MDPHRESQTAPFYAVPARRLVSLEHPAVIRNLDKAIDTLKGNAGIRKILNPTKADTPASLVLRPEDAMARPIQSTSSASNNILLKVTVPKRTGRKRKKGSDEPFADAEPNGAADENELPRRRSARDLLRSLRDNVSSYDVQPVGRIERTHVFRGMPDFVYSTTASSFTNRFREQILPYDLDKLKQFDIDMGKGALRDVDIIPPPSFSSGDVPFPYIYRQNPTVKISVGQSGELTTVNTQQPAKIATHLVSYDAEAVPTTPHEGCPPLNTLDSTLRNTIDALRELFNQRPAWTRRALRNFLTTDEQRTTLRHAIPYVGYIFRSGPWRDAIIKFGVDPRSSPQYRDYQTFMFRILPRDSDGARDGGGGRRHTLPRTEAGVNAALSGTHIFTGEPPLPRDGRIWMARDIQDPQLAAVLYPPTPSDTFLRSTCETIGDGWFGNGTIAKVKTIMRAKIQALIDGQKPVDADFRRVLAFPDHARSEADMVHFTLDSDVPSREMMLATEIRAGKAIATGRGTRSRKKDEDEVGEEEIVQSESEGEEEEIERAEMLEAQVAAAVANRDAMDEDADGRMDDDEDSGAE